MKTPIARPRRPAAAPTGLFPASETRRPAPPPAAAPDTRPRYTNLREIPRTGGPIPASTILTETARIPAQTIRVPVRVSDWEDKRIGERVNLVDADGRTVCDYPLDRLAPYVFEIERKRP